MNNTARDLWAQIFSRAAASPDAAIYNSKLWEGEVQRLCEGLRAAGWNEDQIKARQKSHSELEQPNRPTSPGVAPNLEAHAQIIADRISVALTTKNVAHRPVLVGIEPKVGAEAALTNVIMTDEAILTVTSFFFRWCGLIARAFMRTLLIDPAYWSSSKPSASGDHLLLLRHVELTLYWNRIFTSFASTGTHVFVPFRPATPTEVILFEQIAWSIEYFSFAHEYGHHVLSHRNIMDDPIEQEYEADRFAMGLADDLRFEPFGIYNPYIATGAGSVLVLMANDILRSITGDDAKLSDRNIVLTHPPTQERILRITNMNVMQPIRFAFDREFCFTVTRVMTAVAGVVNAYHDQGGREFTNRIRSYL